jgi:small-conductance mechanosensitive channel
MNIYYIKIIETVVLILAYFIVKKVSSKIIKKTLSERLIQESHGMIIRKVINIVLSIIVTIFTLLIWGVNQADVAVFAGSVLTVVGIAFFAQWSILSNVTSSIIIFFNFHIKLNDTIIILEGKDYELEGKVVDIGLFFVTLETKDSGRITLPNNVIISKMIKTIVNKPNKELTKLN